MGQVFFFVVMLPILKNAGKQEDMERLLVRAKVAVAESIEILKREAPQYLKKELANWERGSTVSKNFCHVSGI